MKSRNSQDGESVDGIRAAPQTVDADIEIDKRVLDIFRNGITIYL